MRIEQNRNQGFFLGRGMEQYCKIRSIDTIAEQSDDGDNLQGDLLRCE